MSEKVLGTCISSPAVVSLSRRQTVRVTDVQHTQASESRVSSDQGSALSDRTTVTAGSVVPYHSLN